MLSLVTLYESRDVVDESDPFVAESEPIYRVLTLEHGTYVQRIYVKVKDPTTGKVEWVQDGDDIIPLGEDGKPFDEIPFQFIGALNNDTAVDRAPLSDLVDVNIAHFRNSADYEEMVYFTGQATFHVDIGTMDAAQFAEANPGGIRVGSRSAIQTRGGRMELVQAQPTSLPKEAMDAKEKQMVALGARIVEPSSQAITATEADANATAETSILATVVDNVSEAYEEALKWMQQFMRGAAGAIAFRLNRDFRVSRLDPQSLLAVIHGWQSGLISQQDAHEYARRAGVATKGFEDTMQVIDDNPPGLNLTTVAAVAANREDPRNV
jgi:hypothetical protein